MLWVRGLEVHLQLQLPPYLSYSIIWQLVVDNAESSLNKIPTINKINYGSRRFRYLFQQGIREFAEYVWKNQYLENKEFMRVRLHLSLFSLNFSSLLKLASITVIAQRRHISLCRRQDSTISYEHSSSSLPRKSARNLRWLRPQKNLQECLLQKLLDEYFQLHFYGADMCQRDESLLKVKGLN